MWAVFEKRGKKKNKRNAFKPKRYYLLRNIVQLHGNGHT